jgi:hypothetical protein
MSKRSVSGTPADPTIEFASIQLRGKEWRLCFDFNAIAAAEQLTGCNLLQGIGGALVHTMTVVQFRALFYAALIKAHPDITLEAAGALITIANMGDIRDALLKSYGVSMPEKKPDNEDPPAADPAAEKSN